jgi:hypothetical protein
METLPTVKATPTQNELTDPKAEIDALVAAPQEETELDLEFLYTRDIEFRQETIYFFTMAIQIIAKVKIQNFTIPTVKNGVNIGAVIYKA